MANSKQPSEALFSEIYVRQDSNTENMVAEGVKYKQKREGVLN